MRMKKRRRFFVMWHSRIVSTLRKLVYDLTDSSPVAFSQGFLFMLEKLCRFEF